MVQRDAVIRLQTLAEWHVRLRQRLREHGWPAPDIDRRADEIMQRALPPESLAVMRASKVPPEEAEGYDRFPFREGDRVEV